MSQLLHRLSIALLFAVSLTIITGVLAQPLIPLPPSNSRETTELLSNSGFETDANNDKIPDGWTGKNTTLVNTDTMKCNKPEQNKFFAHTGNCAFMFRGNANGITSKIQQTLADTSAITDGSEVTFSAYLDTRSGIPNTKFGIAKINYSNGSSTKFTLTIPAARGVEDYQLVSDTQTINLPNGVTITKAKVDFRYSNTSGKFLVDDMSFAVNPPVMLTRLIADDGLPEDYLGTSISISGNTVVVGADGDDINTNSRQGSAYVFTYDGTAWIQQQKLTADNGSAGDYFGTTIAIDNDTVVVGAIYDTIGANYGQGSAYVFTRNGTVWTQQAKLTASDGEAVDYFGKSVAISGDTIIVGAHSDKIGVNDWQGSVYVFTRSGTVWTEQAKLIASDEAVGGEFGYSVAISGDTVVAGAHVEMIGANAEQGSAYVFTRNGTVWTQQAKLIASDGAADQYFGNSVAIDGDNIAIGARLGDIGTSIDQGAAYVFTRIGTVWTEQTKLIASDGKTNDFFGHSIAISDNTIVIGAEGDDIETGADKGSVYIYTYNNSTWMEQFRLSNDDVALGGGFGSSIAIDNESVAVGSPGDRVDTNSYQGSAYVFNLVP